MESRTGAFRKKLLQRNMHKKAGNAGKGSTWFAIVFIAVFVVCVAAYGSYVESAVQKPEAQIGPISIGLDRQRQTSYAITLAAIAGYNKLEQSVIDPSALEADETGKYEFMSLKWVEGITTEELAAMLEGRGVLDGHAQDFLSAARAYDINPVYLAAHARLESGNGTSELSCGIYVKAGSYQDSNKHSYKIEKSAVYYNLFGIRAYDANPVHDGSVYAAGQNWDSVAAAIRGGAQWLSDNYINRSQATSGSWDQDTLYQMRFDPQGWATKKSGHQYATDQKWAASIAGIIVRYEAAFQDAPLVYNIPAFAAQ